MRNLITTGIKTFILTNCVLFICGAMTATAAESSLSKRASSAHAGFFYPNGVDIAGYTVENALSHNFYGYYTFGVPSFAAAGVSYYHDYEGHGLTATLGVGIGSVLYTSIAYQLQLAGQHYLKLGGGYTTGVAYSGLYPALAYEYRFK